MPAKNLKVNLITSVCRLMHNSFSALFATLLMVPIIRLHFFIIILTRMDQPILSSGVLVLYIG